MTRSLSFSSSIWSCSNGMGLVSVTFSELEAGLARGVGQGADAPVIEVPVAVEDDLVDALGEQRLRDALADLLRGVELAGLGDLAPHVARERRRMRDGLARHVVHHLRVDVLRAAEDAEARPLLRPVDPLADAQLPALTSHDLHRHGSLPSAGLRGLARLLADLLALVTHALAAVRLRRTEAADLRGGLTHHFLVGTGQDDDCSLRVARVLALDAGRQRERDRVGEAEGEVEHLPLELRPVAGPHQLERLRVTLGAALHHAADERPGEPLEPRAVPARDGRRDEDGVVLDLRG